MTEAMPFLQKTILLSYDPRPFPGSFFFAFSGELWYSIKNKTFRQWGEKP